MSDSVQVGAAWSAGVAITKKTNFQALGGHAFIATGATAPTKNMAGNRVPDGMAVEIEAGETVYWRTDDTAIVFVSWLEVGA